MATTEEAGSHGVVYVQALIDAQPVSPLQKRLLLLCFLVIAIDGFDTAIIGFIAPAIRGRVAARASHNSGRCSPRDCSG